MGVTLRLKKKPKVVLLTVNEAATRTGIPPQRLRILLQEGKLDIGYATQGKGKKYTYTIFEHKVKALLREVEEAAG